MKKIFYPIIFTLAILTMLTSCNKNTATTEIPTVNHEYEAATGSTEEISTDTLAGNTINFKLVITTADGTNSYGIQSQSATLGGALGGLLAGTYNSDGTFTALAVNGIEAGSGRWQFYVNGELSDLSPDIIPVSDGDTVEARLR